MGPKRRGKKDKDDMGMGMDMDMDIGISTIDPPIPDAWCLDPSANPHAGVSRLCWGWRSDLEVAVRESDYKSVARLVKSHAREDVWIFAECCDLLCKACARGDLKTAKLLMDEVGCDVDGLHFSKHAPPDNNRRCSKQFRDVRKTRGYAGSTPLYGASQGEPGVPLEGRAKVAEYLLKHGADPMLPNDAGTTPLFIAAINNALPIVRDMIDTGKCDVNRPIPDGQTPLSIVRICRRRKKSDSGGEFEEYQPMLDLLESTAKGNGARKGEAGVFEEAVKKKKLGNDSFKKKDFSEAIKLYRHGQALLDTMGNDDSFGSDDEAQNIKELRVILYSNQAEAYLQLGAFLRAEKACDAALALDPTHTKSRSRKERAQKAAKKYRATEARFIAKFQDYCHAAETHEFVHGAKLAAEMKGIANDLDPLKQAAAMLMNAEMCFHEATQNDAPYCLERADQIANEVLTLCHNFERRTYEIDYSQIDEGHFVAVGRLRVKTASAWFLLGKICKEMTGDLKGATVKLNEALAEIDKAIADMNGEYDIEVLNLRVQVWEQLVEVTADEGRWEVASEFAKLILEEVEDAVREGVPREVFKQLAAFNAEAASSLAKGHDATRSLMCRMFYAAADGYAAYNEIEGAAFAYRKLINSRHASWGLQDGDKICPPDDIEAKSDADDVAQLSSLLQKMGRENTDTCSICLESLDGSVVDVLSCLHMFHTDCVRAIFVKYPTSLHHEDGFLVSSGECPNCREKVELMCLPK